jgi:pimeloyl-ACP methyl ester carboxylesterase
MRRRSAVLGGALAAGGVALAGVAGAARVRNYLAREHGRHDPAATDDFSSLSDLTHHTVAGYDDAELHVIERGPRDARPLLFVHGVTLSAEVWRYQLRDLAGPFRVLSLDQRGHGKSLVGRDRYGMAQLGRDLAAVLEALDLRDAVLVGHSMGGMAVQTFCVQHPDVVSERVGGIVLTNTTARPVPMGRQIRPVAGRALKPGTSAPRRVSADASYLGTRYTLGRDALPSHVRYTYELSAATPPEAAIGSVLGFVDMDLRRALREVDVPALVIGGTRDRLLPPRHSQAMAANLPNATLVLLPDCGHMAMLERHSELDRLITEFAESLPALILDAP